MGDVNIYLFERIARFRRVAMWLLRATRGTRTDQNFCGGPWMLTEY